MKPMKTAHGDGFISALRGFYERQRRLFHVLVVWVLVLVAFGRCLDGAFVWDDTGLIVQNPMVHDLSRSAGLFVRGFWNISKNEVDPTRSFYRPIIQLSYAIDYAIWGLNPIGFHLTNLLWYGVAATLVYFLALVLLKKESAALLAACLFAVHPAHAENVCWIAGRTDLLCGTFYFAGLLLFFHWMAHPGRSAVFIPLIAVVYFFALLCKETAITLPGMAVVYLLIRGLLSPGRKGPPRTFAIVIALVTVAYVGLRISVFGSAVSAGAGTTFYERSLTIPFVIAVYLLIYVLYLEHGHAAMSSRIAVWFLLVLCTAFYFWLRVGALGKAIAPAAFGSPFERIATIPFVFAAYLGGLATVVGTDPHHSGPFVGQFLNARFLIGAAVAATYGGLMLVAFRRRSATAMFLMAWIPLTLLPTFKLGSFGDILWADRFLFIPSFGFAVGLAGLAMLLAERVAALQVDRRIVTAAGVAVVLFWAQRSASYAAVWKNNVTLFTRASRTSPDSAYIFFNLGHAWNEVGDAAGALQAYRRAVELRPDYAEAMTNLGIELMRQGRSDEALAWFQKALALGDTTPVLVSNIAAVYRNRGDIANAVRWYEKSLATEPTASAQNNVGECYLALGKPSLALDHFRAALELSQDPAIFNNVARAMIDLGDHRNAVIYLRHALVAVPNLPIELEIAVQFNLARCLLATEGKAAARPAAQRVLVLAQASPVALAAYAQVPWLRDLAGVP